MRKMLAVIAVALLAGTIGAHALVILNAIDSGYYTEGGYHNPNWVNYGAGQFNGPSGVLVERNFFVFDLSGVQGQIVSAQIRLENPWTIWGDLGYESPHNSETYTMFDVTTDITVLRAGGNGLTTIFDDLGSGNAYGSYVATSADNGAAPSLPGGGYVIEFALGNTILTDLNSANGLFAIGGSVTTLSGTPVPEQIFAYTDFAGFTRQLVLETRPVPDTANTILILGATLLTFALAARLPRPKMVRQ